VLTVHHLHMIFIKLENMNVFILSCGRGDISAKALFFMPTFTFREYSNTR